ncbi:MAG: response regulator transcription factor [Verrucomicrobiota bacterium]
MNPRARRPRARRTPPIRVVVADDHPIVRDGLIANLTARTGIKVVAEADNGADALALVEKHRPDVVLLDLRMPRMDGLDVAARLDALRLPVRVIIMTTFDSAEDIERSLKAGVRGYLLKDAPREAILAAIRQVHQGGMCIPEAIAQKAMDAMRRPRISPRELEVLRGVASGKSNKEISGELLITEGTVKTHVKSLLKKFGVAGRTSAVRAAAQRGLIRMT